MFTVSTFFPFSMCFLCLLLSLSVLFYPSYIFSLSTTYRAGSHIVSEKVRAAKKMEANATQTLSLFYGTGSKNSWSLWSLYYVILIHTLQQKEVMGEALTTFPLCMVPMLYLSQLPWNLLTLSWVVLFPLHKTPWVQLVVMFMLSETTITQHTTHNRLCMFATVRRLFFRKM